jgi:hypothetical protein
MNRVSKQVATKLEWSGAEDDVGWCLAHMIRLIEKREADMNYYRFTALEIDEKDSAALALEQVSRLTHDFRHQTLQVVLLLEDAARQVQQDLVALVLEHAVLEELCVLNACGRQRYQALFWVTATRKVIIPIPQNVR